MSASEKPKDGRSRNLPNGGKGRPKGVLNKTTTALKEAILQAAQEVGSDGQGEGGTVGYLKFLAVESPPSFSSLLAKVLPMQVTGADDAPLQIIIRDMTRDG